jgi:long-chain acyl-CoA synthetase
VIRKSVSDPHDHLFYLERPLAFDHFKPHPDAEFIDLSPNGCQATLLDKFWKMIEAGKEPVIGQNGLMSVGTQTDRGVFQCETGGTSGKPKRIRRSAESWLASIRVISQKYTNSSACYGILGDLGHSLAFYAAVEAQIIGNRCVSVVGRSPKEQAHQFARAGVDVIYATPTQMRLLAKSRQALKYVQVVLIGGGRLDPETRERVESLAPNAKVLQFYGAAETSFITLAEPHHDAASVGIAFPGVEIDIRNSNRDGIGEVWVKSPYVFSGYAMGQSNDTCWQDGWLTIGEMGKIDSSGQLFLSGRKSRAFTVSDKTIFPEDIEQYLNANPEVIASAVFPVDDPLRGARIYVALCSDQTDGDHPQRILGDLKERGVIVDRWRLYGLDEWPMLVSGKPNYQEIVSTALEGAWQKL